MTTSTADGKVVQTTEGPIRIIAESVNPKDWDGANWVVFFRHTERLHIAFAYDGFERLYDALKEAQWMERHPILVGKYVADWINDPYKNTK